MKKNIFWQDAFLKLENMSGLCSNTLSHIEVEFIIKRIFHSTNLFIT